MCVHALAHAAPTRPHVQAKPFVKPTVDPKHRHWATLLLCEMGCVSHSDLDAAIVWAKTDDGKLLSLTCSESEFSAHVGAGEDRVHAIKVEEHVALPRADGREGRG